MARIQIKQLQIGVAGLAQSQWYVFTDATLAESTTAGFLNQNFAMSGYNFVNKDFGWLSTSDSESVPIQIIVSQTGVITLANTGDISNITLVGDASHGLTVNQSPIGTWNINLDQDLTATGFPTFENVSLSDLMGFSDATYAIPRVNASGEFSYVSPTTDRPRYLSNDASGSPMWDTIDLSDAGISGILPIANGGTNSGTALANGFLMTSVAGSIVEIGQDISANNFKITNLAAPTQPSDATNKDYVDTAVSNLDNKTACTAATTAALPACTYNNGASGIGATLTANANGSINPLDAVTLSVNNRVLVKDQVSTLQNGIYVITVVGTVSTPWVLTRATDFNQPSEIPVGARTFVTSGTVNQGTTWAETATVTTIGTSPITFVQVGGAAAVTIIGTTNQVNVLAVGATYTLSTPQDIATTSSPTFSAMTLSGLTGSQLVATTAGSQLQTLTTATYPNLTEVSYVKGVTSAIQTQLDGKQPTITPAALTRANDTNVTLTLGGTPGTSLLQSVSITAGWTGVLGVTRGGTGTGTTFTEGSIIYISSVGTYLQNNAAFFWSAAFGRIGIGTNTPGHNITVTRQFAATSGVSQYFNITPLSDTGLTASTEVPLLSVSAATTQWATGALTTQRSNLFGQPTLAFVGASVVTTAATVGIAGAPNGGTNATLTSSAGLLVSTGTVSNVTNSYGAIINVQSGGTAWAAAFPTLGTNGRGISIGSLTGASTLHLTRDAVATGGAVPYFTLQPVADTSLTASTDVPLMSIGTATRQWATGAITAMRNVSIAQPTTAFVGASTVTMAANLAIAGIPTAGTNATLSSSIGLLVEAGSATATQGYGAVIYAPTGSNISYGMAIATTGTNGRGLQIGSLTGGSTLYVTRQAVSGGSTSYFTIAGVADTGLNASTEVASMQIVPVTRTWAAGALTMQRENYFGQPSYAFASASTVTDTATIGILGAPSPSTNATFINSHAILISSASVTASTTNSYGLTVNAQTSGTNNYAAQFIGGRVGIGTAAPAARLDILTTTEQLRVSYDASNYYSTTVSSSGGVTFDAVGAGSAFVFSDSVRATTMGIGQAPISSAMVGITQSTTYGIYLVGAPVTVVDGNSIAIGIFSNPKFVPTSGATAAYNGLFQNKFAAPSAQTIGSCYGVYGSPNLDENVGTLTNVYGFYYAQQGATAGTVTNSYGGFFTTPTGGTNRQALYCADLSVGIAASGTPVAGQIKAGSITFNSTTGVVGSTTNDSAAAGSVGELLSTVVLVGASVALTTATAANIATLSLTAGDWDVWGSVWTNPAAGTTTTKVQAAISQTTATLPTTPALGSSLSVLTGIATAATEGVVLQAGQTRISLSGTTNVYLVASVTFAVSTMGGYGAIYARRRR